MPQERASACIDITVYHCFRKLPEAPGTSCRMISRTRIVHVLLASPPSSVAVDIAIKMRLYDGTDEFGVVFLRSRSRDLGRRETRENNAREMGWKFLSYLSHVNFCSTDPSSACMNTARLFSSLRIIWSNFHFKVFVSLPSLFPRERKAWLARNLSFRYTCKAPMGR